jgi:hypothetical protein
MFSHLWWALLSLQICHLLGARHRRFYVDGGRARTFSSGTSRGPAFDVFTLMVGALGPSAPAPPGGPPLTFSHCWWRSRTFSSGTSRGPAIDIFTLILGVLSTAE